MNCRSSEPQRNHPRPCQIMQYQWRKLQENQKLIEQQNRELLQMYNRINLLLGSPVHGSGYGDQEVTSSYISNSTVHAAGSDSAILFKDRQPHQPCLFNPLNIDMANSVFRGEHPTGTKTDLLVSGRGVDALRNDPISNHCVYPEESQSASTMEDSISPPYTPQQEGQWQQRFCELVAFKEEYGHSCVPSHWPRNAALALWVKRQRSQFKLKEEGKHSNMTEARERALNELGFIWHSHAVHWEERWRELRDFCNKHGHTNVTTKCHLNKQLAIWCKGQRRQFKLFQNGDSRTTMTLERMTKLESLGFSFFLRKNKAL
jgi:Helicase associated domain